MAIISSHTWRCAYLQASPKLSSRNPLKQKQKDAWRGLPSQHRHYASGEPGGASKPSMCAPLWGFGGLEASLYRYSIEQPSAPNPGLLVRPPTYRGSLPAKPTTFVSSLSCKVQHPKTRTRIDRSGLGFSDLDNSNLHFCTPSGIKTKRPEAMTGNEG